MGSIEDVEAQMRSAAAAADQGRILPKSMRMQLQEAAAAEAAEQQLMQEMAVSHGLHSGYPTVQNHSGISQIVQDTARIAQHHTASSC